ncbi:Benzaldehyde dehydrogenase, partial [Pseudomonas savastanoi pv. glycinea]
MQSRHRLCSGLFTARAVHWSGAGDYNHKSRSLNMSASDGTPLLHRAIEAECVFNGDWIPSSSPLLPVIEPATGELLMNTAMADAADIAVACREAALAQPAWAALGPREKAEIFLLAADHAVCAFDELALYVARESGGSLHKGQHEVNEAIVLLRQAAGMLSQAHGHGLMLPSAAGRLSYARRVAHGVVGVISPFNFPLVLSMRSVAPALAAGNAVVLKPDPQTPISGG